jgi:hypothetical protein
MTRPLLSSTPGGATFLQPIAGAVERTRATPSRSWILLRNGLPPSRIRFRVLRAIV